MVSLRQLEYLVAIAELKHFGRAASSLNVSQPTLSIQLQNFEEQLGVRLVDRDRRTVRLTPVGREILPLARRLLVGVKDIEAVADRSRGEMSGTIKFGVSPTIGPYLMPDIITILKRHMPGIRLYIREGIPADQMAELRAGGLDMMLAALPAEGADLHVEPLFREPLHLVAPPEHELSGRKKLNRSDLAGTRILSMDPRLPFHKQTVEICAELKAELLSDYEGTSLDSLSQMCASGLGIAVLPDFYLRSEVGGRNVVAPLSIRNWSATRSIAALWRTAAAYQASYVRIAQIIGEEARRQLGHPLGEAPLRAG